MWILVVLLNLLGRKTFLRLFAGWAVIMLFFMYCFVHEAFDQPRQRQGTMVLPQAQDVQRRTVPASTAAR